MERFERIPERPRNTGFTRSEMGIIRRFEEQERRASESDSDSTDHDDSDEEDYGSDIEGITDAYDSEEDCSFECQDEPEFA
jgi:hypothetical protein